MIAEADVVVRPLLEADLQQADRVFRMALGTFLGAPEPERFGGDSEAVRPRWRADPGGALAADLDGQLVGSSFASNWGSVGVLGPLTVAPDRWDRSVGRRLLDSTMEVFEAWKTSHIGLFTFADSTKPVALYQKYGFWPRYLTAIMSMPVAPAGPPTGTRISEFPHGELPGVLRAIRELTESVYPGLDLSREIDAVLAQKLGDTVLIDDNSGLQAVAVCHVGPGSETGGGACYVKFGAARPGTNSARGFGQLIEACQSLASDRGASVLVAGANAGRDRAWTALADRGFRRQFQGVAMHRPNEAGYSTSDSFVIDDWR